MSNIKEQIKLYDWSDFKDVKAVNKRVRKPKMTQIKIDFKPKFVALKVVDYNKEILVWWSGIEFAVDGMPKEDFVMLRAELKHYLKWGRNGNESCNNGIMHGIYRVIAQQTMDEAYNKINAIDYYSIQSEYLKTMLKDLLMIARKEKYNELLRS
jgi:hypothetical protein